MKKWKGILSVLLAICLLVPTVLPLLPKTAAAENTILYNAMSDPSTVIGSLPLNTSAGAFYADKSVQYDEESNSFSATLSALSKDYQKNVGSSDIVPMDVIVIVDTSASMAEKVVTPDTTDWTRVDYLSWGMNVLIDSVIENTNNRLGVVTFSGNVEVGTSANNARVLLPLSNYSKVDFSVADDSVTLSDGTQDPTKKLDVLYRTAGSYADQTDSITMSGGTFTQTGIAKAYEMIYNDTNRTVTVKGQTVDRTPVVVLLTDGQPTWATQEAMTSVSSSTTSQYGDGSSTSTDMPWLAVLTMFSAKAYSDAMAKLYHHADTSQPNPNYRFMSVGIGVDVLSHVSPAFASAFLDPNVENIAALQTDSAYYTTETAVLDSNNQPINFSQQLYNYLNTNSATDGSVDYATDCYVIDNANTGYALQEVFADIAAISVSTEQTDYFGPLESGTSVTFTDTIGDGMEITSAPVLSYAGTNYYGTRAAGTNEVTYTYSGTVRPLNASDFADYTVELNTMQVRITTDATGRQTLHWVIPSELVPSYSYDTATKSYAAAQPIKLTYDIEPTAQTMQGLSAEETVLYTNNFTDAPTTVTYSLSTESAYYAECFGTHSTISEAKSSNLTETNANSFSASAGATHSTQVTGSDGTQSTIVCAAMTATLGNNGKMILSRADSQPAGENGLSDPSTEITTIRQSATPGSVFVDKTIRYISSNEQFKATLSAITKDYYEILDQSVSVPMDVVFVLDISGSMNTELSGTTSRRMGQVTTQINNLCSSLISANAANRIGIVTYSGAATTVGPTESNANALLAIGTYSAVNLTYTYDSTNDAGTLTAKRNGVSYTNNSVTVTGGTYTQSGIAKAYELLQNLTTRTYTVGGKTYDRTPVIILVTDGQPTWGSSDYTNIQTGTSTVGNGTIGVGDGTTNDVQMDESAYYTILSGQHFAGQMKTLYNGNPKARFYTVGVGMNDMTAETEAVDTAFVSTVLNPTQENVSGLVNSTSVQNYSADLYALLTNSATPYNGTSYADHFFNVSDEAIASLSGALLSALQTDETGEISYGALKSGTSLVFTDTLGSGMQLASAPLLIYGNKTFMPVASGTDYTYSGTVYPDASMTPASLESMRVRISQNANGAQVLTWTIPETLVPSYIYSNGAYQPTTPVYLEYGIEPTAEMKNSGVTLYTNNWTDSPTVASFTVNEGSPLVTTGEINDIPAVIKGVNVTQTNPNVNTTSYNAASGLVTVTLGNNGKWVGEQPELMQLRVNTLWYDADGSRITDSSETTTDTLFRTATDGNGNAVGSSVLVQSMSFGSGTWSGTFTDLPIRDENGNPYVYWISQRITSTSGISYTTTYQVDSGAEQSYCDDISTDNALVTIYNRQPASSDLTVAKQWIGADGNPIADASQLPAVTVQVMQRDTAVGSDPTDPPEPPTQTHTVSFYILGNAFSNQYDCSGLSETNTQNPTTPSFTVEVADGKTLRWTVLEASGLKMYVTDTIQPSITVTSTGTISHTLTHTIVKDGSDNFLTMSGGITVENVTADTEVRVVIDELYLSTSDFERFTYDTSVLETRRSTRAAGQTHTVHFVLNGKSDSGVDECSGLEGASAQSSFAVSVEDGKTLCVRFNEENRLRMWLANKQPTIDVSAAGSAAMSHTLSYELDNAQSISAYMKLKGAVTLENVTSDVTVTILIEETYTTYTDFTDLGYTTELTGGGTTPTEPTEPTVTESVYTTLTLRKENNWFQTLQNLPVRSADGKHTYTYYVIEDSGEDYNVAYTNNGGVTSGTITVTNTVPIGTKPDTVVVDFGLPTVIHVLKNDSFGNGGKVVGVGAVPADMSSTQTLAAGFGFYYTGSFGTAYYSSVDNTVTYNIRSMQMTETEIFCYAVEYNDGTTTRYYYDTVTVVPAEIIYYEESFVLLTGDWQQVGTEPYAQQAEDRPGGFEFPDCDANNVYGYDGAYDNCTTYSLGGAKKVSVNSNTYTEKGAWPKAQFTFTGTSFDLISLTGNQSGFIMCDVYAGTQTATAYRNWVVDTYYGYSRTIDAENPWVKYTWTYDGESWHGVKECVAEKDETQTQELPTAPQAGQTCVQYKENYVWTPATGANDLYQIPVIKSPELPYGTYTVVITAAYIPFFDNTGTGGYDFCLDAVRVYHPAENLEDYYVQDAEAWPQYIELRKQLLTKDEANNATSYVQGISFIDGVSDGLASDYENYGPNNEIYLNPNQSVAFAIESHGSEIASVQIGMKTFADAGKLSASCVDANGNALAQGAYEIATHTDMFYSLTNLNGASCLQWKTAQTTSHAIVLTNTGAAPVTLTTLKITYAALPAQQAELCMNTSLMQAVGRNVRKLLSAAGGCVHKCSYQVLTAPTETQPGVLLSACKKCSVQEKLALPVLGDDSYTVSVKAYPSCVQGGLQTYRSVQDGFSFDVALPALGHDLAVTAGVAATCTSEGLSDGSHCRRCGYRSVQTVTAPLEHTFDENGLCTCGERSVCIEGASLRLDEDIDIIFNAKIPQGAAAFMSFTMNGRTVRVEDDGSHTFRFEGVNPQCIGDTVDAELTVVSGNTTCTCKVEGYSVRSYCVNLLKKPEISASLRRLLSDLLAYGAAAQLYMDYKTDALVNAGEDILNPTYSENGEIPASKAILDGTAQTDTRWVSAGLTLTNSVAMRFCFYAQDISDLTLNITLNGRRQSFTRFTAVEGKENYYEISFTGISAEEFADAVTADFERNGGKIGNTLTYSVNAYIHAKQNTSDTNLAALVKALYRYGAAANAYINETEDAE